MKHFTYLLILACLLGVSTLPCQGQAVTLGSGVGIPVLDYSNINGLFDLLGSNVIVQDIIVDGDFPIC